MVTAGPAIAALAISECWLWRGALGVGGVSTMTTSGVIWRKRGAHFFRFEVEGGVAAGTIYRLVYTIARVRICFF